jgi:pyruvate dehydrogenase E2 component (dihydrolipoamide acetyltransferase)
VPATGPDGRILKADVLKAAGVRREAVEDGLVGAQREAEAATSTREAATAPLVRGAGDTAQPQPMTRSQQLVARRMAASRGTVPDFTVCMEIDVTEALQLRERLRGVIDPTPTLNDLVVVAAGRTLARHPRLNSSYADEAFVFHDQVNVGIAVAAGDELLVPVLADANRKSLAAVAAEAQRLVSRARSGEITPAELAGATFTVSNLGMFGVSFFQPIINPPQAAILAIGASRPTSGPGAEDQSATQRNRMNVTLVSDHRIVYGAHAAQFLADVRDLLQQPLRLLVDSRQQQSA